MSASLLRRVLSVLLARDNVERIIDPLLADAAAEHRAAVDAGRPWTARWTTLRAAGDLARTLLLLVSTTAIDGARAMRWSLPICAAAIAAIGWLLVREVGPGRHGAQATWMAVAAAASIAWLAFPPRWLAARRSWFALAASLMAWPALAGDAHDGAQRWVSVGPLRLTPGELARPLLLLAVAGALRSRQRSRAALAEATVMTALSAAALAWQPDLAGAAVVLCACGAMLVDVAGARGALAIALAVVVSIGCALARGTLGALWIAGAGDASQAADTDLLLASAVERFGIAGAVLPLALLVVLATQLWRAPTNAAQLPRTLARGAAVALVSQAALHASAALGLLPRAAVTLPLLGYGGSSLVSWMLCIAVVGSAVGVGGCREVVVDPMGGRASRR